VPPFNAILVVTSTSTPFIISNQLIVSAILPEFQTNVPNEINVFLRFALVFAKPIDIFLTSQLKVGFG
jgi:hypothetical protein